jgi:hypothetical protein
VETVIDNLVTLISTVTQVVLTFGKVTKNVAVDRDRTAFSFTLDGEEMSGAPNSLAHRSGHLNLVLVEKVS